MRNVLKEQTYNGLHLNNSAKNNAGFYEEILQPIEALMRHMVRKHNQVFCVRFDLRYPSDSAHLYPQDNTLLSRFIEALTRHCKRLRYDPKYVWARERSMVTGNRHYHFILLLDGDYCQSTNRLLVKATELWQRCLNIEDNQGLVHICPPDKYIENQYSRGVKIRRNAANFQQVFEQYFKWVTYLGKCYSKGQLATYVNEFGYSRLS